MAAATPNKGFIRNNLHQKIEFLYFGSLPEAGMVVVCFLHVGPACHTLLEMNLTFSKFSILPSKTVERLFFVMAGKETTYKIYPKLSHTLSSFRL